MHGQNEPPEESLTEAEKIAVNIGERITALRAQRKLSLQEVADRAGISKSHVWDLEQGNARNPTIDTAVRIASALGVSLDYLTGLSNSQPPMHPEALRIACEVDAIIRAAITQEKRHD